MNMVPDITYLQLDGNCCALEIKSCDASSDAEDCLSQSPTVAQQLQ